MSPSDVVSEPAEHAADRAGADAAADHAALVRARDLFTQGQDRQALTALYDAGITALVDACGITLAPRMTHWETYDAIEAAVPEVQAPLRRLTLAYELSRYRGTPLTTVNQDAACEAFRSIMRRVYERAQVHQS